jgi:hypothetical protein
MRCVACGFEFVAHRVERGMFRNITAERRASPSPATAELAIGVQW